MKTKTAWWVWGVSALIALFVIVGFGKFVRPAPPKSVVFSAGAETGAYFRYAKAYAATFAEAGIDLIVRSSAGSVENVARLANSKSEYDAALIQSGIGDATKETALVALGALAYEPLWIFVRTPANGTAPRRIAALTGTRIGVGAPGSGSRKVALDLLTESAIVNSNTSLLEEPTAESVAKLLAGTLDAVMFIAALDAPMVRELFSAPGVTAMSIELADAYARRLPALSKIIIPHGVIDLVRNIPDQDITTLATTANLVAKEDTHPAILYLLLKAAQSVHSKPTLTSRTGEFPSLIPAQDYEIAEEAKRFYKDGQPFLYKYLPFGLANFLSRFLVILLPALALILPLTDWIPKLQTFMLKRKFFKHYDEIRAIDIAVVQLTSFDEIHSARARLDAIELRINAIKTPTMYSSLPYDLRDHIDLVRVRLDRRVDSLKN